jgi:lysozyme family protein
MTASNREASISKTLTYEGGYTNDPRDPGGATNWGITIFDARLYWKHDASPADVKAMPKSVAIDIYRQKYWAKLGCDARPAGVDFVEFDFGVNSGVKRALAYRSALDPQKLKPVAYVKAYCAKRSSFLHGLKTWAVFGKGWGRRVADVEAAGVRMAAGAAGKPVAPVLKKEAAQNSGKAIGHSTAGAGTGFTLPHIDFATLTGTALVVVGVVVLAYFVWHAVQSNHRANAYNAALKNA